MRGTPPCPPSRTCRPPWRWRRRGSMGTMCTSTSRWEAWSTKTSTTFHSMLSESRRMILVKKRGTMISQTQATPHTLTTFSANPILDSDPKPCEPSLSLSPCKEKCQFLSSQGKHFFSGFILIWMFDTIKKFMLEANLEHTVCYNPRARKISKQA